MTRQPVVVGVDSSPNARAALEWAAAYAAECERPLIVVHALGLLEAAATSRDDVTASYETALAALGPTASFVLRDGDPVAALLAEAHERDAATMVVGRRGEGARGAAALGSTSLQIAERADRPVVVVPPPC